MVKNSTQRPIKVIIAILLIMAALVSQPFVMAQTPTAEVEIIGTLTAMTARSITVGTQIFDISLAEIKQGLEVGKLVRVHAVQNTSGQWVAREIALALPNAAHTPAPNMTPTPSPINSFEITGKITTLTDSSITVGGQAIDISDTEIKNSFAINDRIKLHVIVIKDQWIAREVESASIPVTVQANCTLLNLLAGLHIPSKVVILYRVLPLNQVVIFRPLQVQTASTILALYGLSRPYLFRNNPLSFPETARNMVTILMTIMATILVQTTPAITVLTMVVQAVTAVDLTTVVGAVKGFR